MRTDMPQVGIIDMTPHQRGLTVVIGLTACTVLVAAVLGLQRRPDRAALMMAARHAPTAAAQGAERAHDASPGPQPSAPPAAASSIYKTSFATARNYWTYAHQILAAARAGDADAQYYLARVLEACSEANSLYFKHHENILNLDEALQYAVKRDLPVEMAQRTYDRCHDFRDQDPSDLGNAGDWLARANDAAQPLALATTAGKVFIRSRVHVEAQADGGPPADSPINPGADPRTLLRAAVSSREPEVLFDIGSLIGALDTANPSEELTTRLAWWLVACQRGFDCSAQADWVLNSCAGHPDCDSAASPGDLVRSLAEDRWPDVQQRARQIDAGLSAGDWGSLGLGP